MDLVSVVIPTLNRQERLRRAVASALAQRGLEEIEVEILVVDNSRDANARATIEAFGAAAVRYFSEPSPGVANARNCGVAQARGRWVAFLDDDEEAAPNWIAALTATARRSNADAVFGPIEGRAEGAGEIGGFSPYFSRRVEAADGADITHFSAYLGTNNSMFERPSCLAGAATFDTSLNESGGEDSLLLERLRLTGRRFAWAAEARVVEWAPASRLTWAYVRKRKFLSGQIRVFVRRMASPARWDVVAAWMAVGAAQFVAAGLASLVFRPFAPERAARAEATAYGGLGKVLWQRAFRPALYGAGLVS